MLKHPLHPQKVLFDHLVCPTCIVQLVLWNVNLIYGLIIFKKSYQDTHQRVSQNGSYATCWMPGGVLFIDPRALLMEKEVRCFPRVFQPKMQSGRLQDQPKHDIFSRMEHLDTVDFKDSHKQNIFGDH